MKRNARALIGFLSGVAATVAYLVSCGDSAMSVSQGGTGGTAAEVTYVGVRSGLKATNVQAAIDEIGTTVRSATTSPRTAMRQPRGLLRSAHADDAAAGPTTWTIQVSTLNTSTETLDTSAGGTVTFTETAPGQGTYTTSGANVLLKSGLFGLPANHAPSGKYFIVGNALVITGRQSTNPPEGLTWRLTVGDSGSTMSLDDGAAFLVLTKN